MNPTIKRYILAKTCALVTLITADLNGATLQFFEPFTGGIGSNFANAAGTPSNNLYWGIIVDTNGQGFETSYSMNFTLQLGLATIIGTKNNVLVIGDGRTSDSSTLQEDLSQPTAINGALGTIGSISDLTYSSVAGLSSGDPFRIIWFDPSGTSAGFVSNNAFSLPPDSDTTSFSSIFLGQDTIRPAIGITFTPIPEPSTFLIGSVGCLMLIRRRR